MAENAHIYKAPHGLEPSADYLLRVDGRPVFVYPHSACSYAKLELRGPATFEVEPAFTWRDVKIRPLSAGIEPEVANGRIRFSLDEPRYLSIELDGDLRRPLLVWALPPEIDRPSPEQVTHCFAGGRKYDAGILELHSGDSVYIEGGAVVYGALHAECAQEVRIAGRGILHGGRLPGRTEPQPGPRLLVLVDCQGVGLEGVSVVDSPRWSVVPVGCTDVDIGWVQIITDHVGGDGVDLVGCSDARVHDCFMRTADDCVALKASTYRVACGGRDIRNVTVEGCTLWNARPGNVLEIGYETRCDTISDATFRDCDVLHCEYEGHQSGGVLTIHNGDRARIRNVLYQDIRVEDAQEKLIDVKILLARYSRDEKRGQIGGLRFKDIAVVDGPSPVSIVRGYDEGHMIGPVTVENMTIHGQPVRNFRDARMVAELVAQPRVQFIAPA